MNCQTENQLHEMSIKYSLFCKSLRKWRQGAIDISTQRFQPVALVLRHVERVGAAEHSPSPHVNYKPIRKGHHHIETEVIIGDVGYHY